MLNIRMRFPGFKFKAFTMSYDDGATHDIRLIETMERYGVKGTFNLNSKFLTNTYNGWYITPEQALETYKNQEVAAHGAYHLALKGLDSALIADEILINRKDLEKLFGRVVKGMAYAYGSYDQEVEAVLKTCGIVYSRTTGNVDDFSLPADWLAWHATCHHANPRLGELTDNFLALDGNDPRTHLHFPKLFYVWGHSYEFDREKNWDLLEGLLEKVSGKEDIWYATNGEIYQYAEDFKRLQFSANCEWVFNPTAQDIFFLANGKEIVAKSGETTRINEQ